MTLLQNRMVAWLLCLCMAASSTLAGSRASLMRLREQAELAYTQGELLNGMGIAYDLARMEEECGNLLTVSARYLDDSNHYVAELSAAREALAQAQGPAAQNAASHRLLAAAAALGDHLGALSLSERDAAYRDIIRVNLESHSATIRANPYNARAAAFNGALQKQPAGTLAAITGVKPLELYA